MQSTGVTKVIYEGRCSGTSGRLGDQIWWIFCATATRPVRTADILSEDDAETGV